MPVRPLSAIPWICAALLVLPACAGGSGGAGGADAAPVGDAPPLTGIAGKDDPMPAATVQDCDGQDIDLNAWLGDHDVSYVTFAAKWCTACQEEVPIINEQLVQIYDASQVGVLQILIENDPGEPPPLPLCAGWRDSFGAEFPVLIDLDQEMIGQHFGEAVGQLPVHLIVTSDTIIRYRKVGAIPEDIGQRVGDWL